MQETEYGLVPHMVDSKSDISPSPFIEKSEKRFSVNHPIVIAGIAAAAIAGVGEAAKVINNEIHQAPAAEHSMTVEHNTDITPALEAQLDDIQRQLDTPVAPPEVPPFNWKQVNMPGLTPDRPVIQFEIQQGKGIIESAEVAYEHYTGHPMSATAKDSLTVTARNYEKRIEEKGGNRHLEAGTILDLTDVEIAGDGVERAVVSNSVVDDAPSVEPPSKNL